MGKENMTMNNEDRLNTSLLVKASKSYMEQNWRQAIKYFDEYLKSHPNDMKSIVLKANCLNNIEEYGKAIHLYNRALESKPSSPDILRYKGNSLTQVGRHKEAIECFEKSIELDQNNKETYFRMGYVYYDLGHYNDSITYYKKAIEIDGKWALAWEWMGHAYNKLYMIKDYIRCHEKAKSLDPSKKYPGLQLRMEIDENRQDLRKNLSFPVLILSIPVSILLVILLPLTQISLFWFVILFLFSRFIDIFVTHIQLKYDPHFIEGNPFARYNKITGLFILQQLGFIGLHIGVYYGISLVNLQIAIVYIIIWSLVGFIAVMINLFFPIVAIYRSEHKKEKYNEKIEKILKNKYGIDKSTMSFTEGVFSNDKITQLTKKEHEKLHLRFLWVFIGFMTLIVGILFFFMFKIILI